MRSLCYFSWVYSEIITDITTLPAEVCRKFSETESRWKRGEIVTHGDTGSCEAAGYNLEWSQMELISYCKQFRAIISCQNPKRRQKDPLFWLLVITICLAFNLRRHCGSTFLRRCYCSWACPLVEDEFQAAAQTEACCLSLLGVKVGLKATLLFSKGSA